MGGVAGCEAAAPAAAAAPEHLLKVLVISLFFWLVIIYGQHVQDAVPPSNVSRGRMGPLTDKSGCQHGNLPIDGAMNLRLIYQDAF